LIIEAERLSVSNGAVVSASTTTTGRGGNLTVKASDLIELSGTSPVEAPSGAFTFASRVPSSLQNSTTGDGTGGDLTIDTRRLVIRDGAWVITVQTHSLTITDGAALTASTSGQGNAGNIFVECWKSHD
jgi:large exoprotein involved in heme utilization and adhesion